MATPSYEGRGRDNLDDATDEPVNAHASKRRRLGYDDRNHPHGGAAKSSRTLTPDQYAVGWICALPTELVAAEAMLDVVHEGLPKHPNDNNTYTLGNIGPHNIVIACLPAHGYGTNNAAAVAKDMDRSFPFIRVRLMVGIGGGVPTKVDVRLGDVVVSTAVVQHDMGKTLQEGHLHRTATPRIPPTSVMTAVSKLQANHSKGPSRISSIISESLGQGLLAVDYTRQSSFQDRLFDSSYDHVGLATNCDQCDASRLLKRDPRRNDNPGIHYGVIASSNQVIRHAKSRDRLAEELDVLCFEMEAAGLMDNFPCLVIRGICDYSDSHKNKAWQQYAAAVAAAYAKELLQVMNPNEIRKHIDNTASSLTEQALKDQRQALLDSLMFEQMDFRETNIKNRHAKTCDWFFQHPDYINWLDPASYDQHNGFLWIKGKPGAGKSTLMKFIYSQTKKTGQVGVVTSFFFNARGDKLEKSTEGMYRSILLQVLEKLPAIQEILDDPELVTRCKRPTFTWTTAALHDLFANMIKQLGQQSLICFIDALDECDEDQVQEMIENFEYLGECAAEAKVNLHICFSSRHYPHIEISNGLEIVLEGQAGHEKDLEKYVQTKLKAKPAEFAKKTAATILEKAAGVFMWAVLVVEIINKEIRKGRQFMVLDRLAELPPQLSELFKDILRRDNDNMECMLFSIQLILYAKRPLTREEFYFAVLCKQAPDKALIPWDPEATTTESMLLYVLSSTKGLAEVTRSKTQTVQFIHESVRDFLIKDNGMKDLWPDLPEDLATVSHDRIKECCCAYMKVDISNYIPPDQMLPTAKSDEAKALRQSVSKSFPFLEYATGHILHHADMAGFRISQDGFLQSFDLRSWIKLRNLFERHQVRRYTPSASLLYILADNGLSQLVRLQHGPNTIRKEGERYDNPLVAALVNGYEDIAVSLLQLEHGSAGDGVIPQADMREAALFCAATAGMDKVALASLESGADVDLRKNTREMPLLEAFRRGFKHNIYVEWRHSPTPLLVASEQGHGGVVQLLLSHSANVDLADNSGQTPLLQATKHGHEELMLLLLNHGANVDLADNSGQTPLLQATKHGHEELGRLLRNRGADISPTNQQRQALLILAARQGYQELVQQLLHRGANPNTAGSNKDTPLHEALYRLRYSGNLEVVELLLGHGANVESRGSLGQTPLLLASQFGCQWAVERFLNLGADIHERDIYDMTPLAAAVKGGHVEIVRLMIDWGASINADEQILPLKVAAISGRVQVMKLLLEKGADVNVRGRQYIPYFVNGSTALIVAAMGRDPEPVRLLLESGAQVSPIDEDGRSALSHACARGHIDIVRLLLDWGIEMIMVRDRHGRTPLSRARRNGHGEIVKMLLGKGAIDV